MTRAPINDREGRCEEPAKEAVLLALAERCEKATGPDRELDAEVHHAFLHGTGTGMYGNQPAYSASLDAAMSLVPEGWDWGAGHGIDPDAVHPHGWGWTGPDGEGPYAFARSAALALCAAALRARAQSGAAS